MEGLSCRGQMRWEKAPFRADRQGYAVSWDSLPAWVCPQCGEVLFEVREVDLIQEALAVLERETGILLVGKN